MDLAYYNGKLAPLEEMTVPLNDRAMYFGDGVYDATMCWNGRIYEADRHVERFFNSMAMLSLVPPLDRKQLTEELQMVLDESGEKEWALLYWSATRGTAPRGHAFPEHTASNLIITVVKKSGIRDPYQHMKLITYPDRRFEYCNIKTLNLIPSCLASEAAKQAGCDEAVFYRGDEVTECSRSNLFLIKNGRLKTAQADEWILPGIARRDLIERAGELKIPVEEKRFTLREMMEADEVIVTSSGTVGSPVSMIDGIPVGGKAPELLERLRSHAVRHMEQELGCCICKKAGETQGKSPA